VILTTLCLLAPLSPLGCPTAQAAPSFFDTLKKTLQGIDVAAEAELQATLPKAAAGDPEAQFKAAEMFREGKATEKNDGEALKWYRRAADQGHPAAQGRLGRLYEKGIGVARDETEAAAWYRKAAEQGEAPAQAALGLLYENGRGVAKDDTEAVKWYRRAADQGHAPGQSGLGYMYRRGRGVEQNPAKALELYRKAAEQGEARGQWGLGNLHARGLGVAKNDPEAVKWFRLSAEQGYAPAQDWLGFMYREGRGVDKSDSFAVEWFRKAAEQGHASGQYQLGFMVESGRGLSRNDGEAARWYRLAAEQGNAPAQNRVALFYKQGRGGLEKNPREAARWFSKSLAQGNKQALQEMEALYEEQGYGAFPVATGAFTLEGHLASQSLTVTDVRHSADGSTLLTRAATADGKISDFTLWQYDARRQAFLNGWFSIRTAAETLGPSFDLSADGSTLLLHRNDAKGQRLAVIRQGSEKKIPLKWGHGASVTGVRTFVLALSHDGSDIAVAHTAASKFSNVFMQTYAVATGGLQKHVEEHGQPPERIFFDPRKRFLVLQEKYPEENTQQTRLLEVPTLKKIAAWYHSQCFGFNDDGSLLAIRSRGKTVLLDPADRKETPLPEKASAVVFGPANKLLLIWNNGFEEHLLLPDRRTAFLQRSLFQRDTTPAEALYVRPADAWYAFGKDRVLTLQTTSGDRLDAALTLQKGRALLAAGFHREGIQKIKEAVVLFPLIDGFSSGFYQGLEQLKTPLAEIGDLLVFQVRELLKADGKGAAPEAGSEQDGKKEALARAVYRLANYGTFAVRAGHPYLARQAAQRIRQLQQGHPASAPWDALLKYAVALEALVLAATDSPDKAYSHILQHDGLIREEYGEYQISTVKNFPDYWAPLYADRKKLAYILKTEETKLPTPKAPPPPPQPFPDLQGNLLTPLAAPPGLETAPPAIPAPLPASPVQQQGAPLPKGRVLD
jgi:TPR repeat protein